MPTQKVRDIRGLPRVSEATPYSDATIKKLRRQEENLRKRIETLQDACEHDNEITDQYNDGDGYSSPHVNWYATLHCKKCDKHETVFTGQGY